MANVEAVHIMFIVQNNKEQAFATYREDLVAPDEFTKTEFNKFRFLKKVLGGYDYRVYARYSDTFIWECASVQLYTPSGKWFKIFSIPLDVQGLPDEHFDISEVKYSVPWISEEKTNQDRSKPEYIALSEQNMMLLLNCIVQYGRIMRKDIRSNKGVEIEAAILDLFAGTSTIEKVLLDYTTEIVSNPMPIIGGITHLKTNEIFQKCSTNNTIIVEQFCNYSSLINFDTGLINAIVLYRTAKLHEEKKAFIQFDVKTFVNSLCRYEFSNESAYAIRIEELIEC